MTDTPQKIVDDVLESVVSTRPKDSVIDGFVLRIQALIDEKQALLDEVIKALEDLLPIASLSMVGDNQIEQACAVLAKVKSCKANR